MIEATDIRPTKSQVVGDGSTNGGRLGTVAVGSGVVGSVFPDAGQAERTAGSTKYRKVFWHNRNASNETAYDFRLFVENYTPGGDEIVFFPGTQTDTQADITGSEALYGCGQLNANADSGATSITVLVHDWAGLPIFRNGDTLRISNKATLDGVGDEEFVTIHASTAITAAGNVVTIPLATALVGSYTAAATRVASVYDYGDLAPTITDWTETSAAGTYDEGTYPVAGTNRGTIEQVWTITFTSATAFNVSGDTLGAMGSGTISANFAPSNTGAGAAYFTLDKNGWGGTWAPGDTLVFETHPAACPLWLLRDIPAVTAAQNGNKAVIAWMAGSE